MKLKTQSLRRHSRTCTLMKKEAVVAAGLVMLVLLVLSELRLRDE
jgi:hypothetical protein